MKRVIARVASFITTREMTTTMAIVTGLATNQSAAFASSSLCVHRKTATHAAEPFEPHDSISCGVTAATIIPARPRSGLRAAAP